MTAAPTAFARTGSVAMAVVRHPLTVWVAFVAVHLWLGLLNLFAPGLPLGDVTIVYKFWMDQATIADHWVGIDTVWVYPILALVPMLAATVAGPEQYAATWLTMIMLLNAVAFGMLTGWGRSRERVAAAWWWVGFLLLLGPIALGRIDAVTVAVALVGVLLLARAPRAAGVVLAVAMWVKVWPAVLLGAAVVALRERFRVALAAIVTSGAILLGALLLGSGANVLSFITQQTGRGLQIEAPVSTVWLWQVAARVPGTVIYYDRDILTYQVDGAGVATAAAVMTPILAVVVLGILALGVLAHRRGVAVGDLLPPLALALVTALIAFNKVGSPQFISWLAVPILLGLVTRAAGHGGSFRTPAVLGVVIAALTQLIYPYFYTSLLTADALMLGIITVRNTLLFVLLGWAIRAVVVARRDHHAADEAGQDWLASPWPFPRDQSIDPESTNPVRE